jgi:hypothetical protein
MRDSRRDVRSAHVLAVVLFSSLLHFGCAKQDQGTEALSAPPPVPASATPYNKALDFDLSASPVINNATITISNEGADYLVLPSVFATGGYALNRSSIMSGVQSAGSLTPEQFALATWKLVSQDTFHFCSAGAPGDPLAYAVEPLRVLSGFGFTCCDQSSNVLDWLWQAGGYQTRVVSMTFHTAPEIFYSGAWHLYDPDHKVYYLAEDNKTVASAAQIIADPSLVARVADANGNDPIGYPAEWMAQQYAASTPVYLTNDYQIAATYGLQPQQSFTLRSQNLTTNIFDYFVQDDPDLLPWNVTSGQFDWALDFARIDWRQFPVSLDGIGTFPGSTDVFITNVAAKSGNIVYYISSPFPVFSLQVSGIVYRDNSAASVSAYFSNDGAHWSAAFPMNPEPGTPAQTTADLSPAAVGQYSYFVMLSLSGGAPDAARIAAVHITSEVQVAKILFPNLVPGTINHLTYQDWSPALDQHDVKVSVTVQ